MDQDIVQEQYLVLVHHDQSVLSENFQYLARAFFTCFTLGDVVHVDYSLSVQEDENHFFLSGSHGLWPFWGLADPFSPTALTAASFHKCKRIRQTPPWSLGCSGPPMRAAKECQEVLLQSTFSCFLAVESNLVKQRADFFTKPKCH
jgi:hypothetical protein